MPCILCIVHFCEPTHATKGHNEVRQTGTRQEVSLQLLLLASEAILLALNSGTRLAIVGEDTNHVI